MRLPGKRNDTIEGASSRARWSAVSVCPMKAWTSSGSPMKCQARANLWWPSSNTSGPPPDCSVRCRQAMALSGTSQAVALRPGLLLMRMESGVPIASSAISSRARTTGG